MVATRKWLIDIDTDVMITSFIVYGHFAGLRCSWWQTMKISTSTILATTVLLLIKKATAIDTVVDTVQSSRHRRTEGHGPYFLA